MKRVRVIKLGGSLLLMPQLKEKFQKWCQQNPHPLTLIVVGGGAIVDAVRNIHAVNALPEDFAHWVCIDLMRHTARLAQQILGEVDLYETVDDLQRAFTGAANDGARPIVAIVQPGICFARGFPNMGLPETWEVTSDALAAAFSQMYAAEEMVVMKSIDPPGDSRNHRELADRGFIDRHFPDLAEEIERVRFVNLWSETC
ncbi:MAG: hypothetical protein KDB01_04290 [Planctomycetaceae bacterium]|nr:hypothetical protein [Planctomycetaceae bacterium]